MGAVLKTIEELGALEGEASKLEKVFLEAGLPFDVTLVGAEDGFLTYSMEVGGVFFELIWHDGDLAVRTLSVDESVENLEFVYTDDPEVADEPSDLRDSLEDYVELVHTRIRLADLPLVVGNPGVFGLADSAAGVLLADELAVYELRFVDETYHLLLHVLEPVESEDAEDDLDDADIEEDDDAELVGYSLPVPLHPVMKDAYLGLIAKKCGLNGAQELVDELRSVLVPETLDD